MTDEERRQARRNGAGAVLHASRQTREHMVRAADVAIAQAAHALRQRSAAKRASALIVLLDASKRMANGLARAIADGRAEARSLAAKRLGTELRSAGASSETASWGRLAGSHVERMSVDGLEATSAAESLAGQWRALASRSVLAAQRNGEDVAAAVSGSRDPLLSRIERTAETEAVRAYNDEHLSRVRDLVASGDVEPDAVMREWSAEIDACERCFPHHGEQVGINENFSGGDEPGDMHPRCRCYETIVPAGSPKPAAKKKEVEPEPEESAAKRVQGIIRDAGGLHSGADYIGKGKPPSPEGGFRMDSIAYWRAQRAKGNLAGEPVKVGIEQLRGGGHHVWIIDGRHRMVTAHEAGAKSIDAVVRLYGPRGGLKNEVRTKVKL